MKNFLIRIVMSVALALFTYFLLLLTHTPDRIPLIVAGIIGSAALLFYGWDYQLRSDAIGLGIQFVIPLLIGAGIWYFWGSYQIHNTWGKVVPILCGIAVGYIIFIVTISGRGPQSVFIRGSSLIDYKSASELSAKLVAPGELSLYWGGLKLPLKAAENHFLVTGTIGSGKTITIDLLMSSVLPHINQQEKWKAVVYDAKGDSVSKLKYLHKGSEIVILNPFDKRCTAWDLAADVTSERHAQSLASVLFPKNPRAESPFWDNAAQALFQAIVLTFATRPESKGKWTLRDALLGMRTQRRLRAVLGLLSNQNADVIEGYLQNPKTSSNIMADIQGRIKEYKIIAAHWHHAKSRISLQQWASQNSVLVLGRSTKAPDALKALNAIIFNRISQIVLDEAENPPGKTWFFLDEFSKAGKLPMLDELASTGRTKGVVLVLGFQDIAGVREVYGHNLTDELTNVVGNKAILHLAGGATAQWAQEQFGYQEILDPSTTYQSSSSSQGTSSSQSTSWNKRVQPIIMASEFTSFPLVTQATPPGVVGCFQTPMIGNYSVNVTLKSVQSMLGNIVGRDASEDYLPTDEENDTLQDWTEADLTRLGLPESFLQNSSDNIDDSAIDYED